MKVSQKVRSLDQRWYAGINDNWDDTLFRETILGHVHPGARVLDLGAGAGIVTQMNFRGLAAHMCGVDLDERVMQNPYLDEAHVGSGEQLPLPADSFDVVFADNVLEHLPDPARVFAEVRRVLKPGGVFLAKTPNKWHYMPMIARLTPHSFHGFYNRLRGRATVDTFPTRYKANSRGDLARLARATGLQIESLRVIESRPEYLRINAAAYVGGIAWERLLNSSKLLEGLRILLVVEMRKPRSP
jgi:SAM-dependent methyltransferase